MGKKNNLKYKYFILPLDMKQESKQQNNFS